MTDEQFQALAKYEATFDQALHKGRAPYPGRAVIESFLAVMRSTNPRYKTNLNCGEKQDREKAAREALAVAEETPAPEKPKKTRKKKETAE